MSSRAGVILAFVAAACATSGEVEEQASGNPGQGEALIAQMQCTACHAASEVTLARLRPDPAPRLERIGARRTPEALRRILLDPRSAKPGSAMPDVLASLPERERARVADELAHFLASLGGPLELETVELDAAEMERGRQLFHSVGCVACHVPQESIDDLEAPLWSFSRDEALAPCIADELGEVAFDTSVGALTEFLLDPLAARPAGRMPAMKLAPDEARAIAVYMLRGRVGEIEERPGWRVEYFELEQSQPDFAAIAPVRTGVVESIDLSSGHRDEHFAFRFTGIVDMPKTGMNELAITSDDGSWLFVDGKLVVDNGGDHAPSEKSAEVWLEKGKHLIEVRMYENSGGQELAVEWRPPGGARGAIPASAVVHWSMAMEPGNEADFELDAGKVERGRARYDALGCAVCHELEGFDSTPPAAPALTDLAPHWARGCLAKLPEGRAQRYDIDAGERASIQLAVIDATTLATPHEPLEQLHTALARNQCLRCHTLYNAGGPPQELVGYFKEAVEVDLGNEGRLPPRLDSVGAKLHERATRRILLEGVTERPYLATRMPQFGEASVGHLPALFEALHGSPSDLDAPPFDASEAELGRQLAGEKSLGCVQCHLFNGTRSLGIPAVDLAHVQARIKPAWFQKLLLDPKSLGMNSRMPVFTDSSGVSAARDILGGDPKAQARALWSYVSLGSAMPLPDGLAVPDQEYELVPKDEPILVSVFFEGASARTMLVGTPELVHYAFDIENSRLVCAWRGRFYNAKGTWQGRAGQLEKPPSEDVVWFPKLPTVAILPSPDAPWPTELGREAGFQRLGWAGATKSTYAGMTSRPRAGGPGFRYALGDLQISETHTPLTRMGGPPLWRWFSISTKEPVEGVNVLLAGGRTIERAGEQTWLVDGSVSMEVQFSSLTPWIEPHIVDGPQGVELRVAARFTRMDWGEHLFDVSTFVSW